MRHDRTSGTARWIGSACVLLALLPCLPARCMAQAQSGAQSLLGKTQLVPDLADDVYFTSDLITLGGWGVGLYIAGKPIDGLGGLRLDYGTSVASRRSMRSGLGSARLSFSKTLPGPPAGILRRSAGSVTYRSGRLGSPWSWIWPQRP